MTPQALLNSSQFNRGHCGFHYKQASRGLQLEGEEAERALPLTMDYEFHCPAAEPY